MLCWASYRAVFSCFKALLKHIHITGNLTTQLTVPKTGTVTATTLSIMCKPLASCWGLRYQTWSNYKAQWGSLQCVKHMFSATWLIVKIVIPDLPGKVSKQCSWVAVLWLSWLSLQPAVKGWFQHMGAPVVLAFSRLFLFFLQGSDRGPETQCGTWCRDAGPSRRIQPRFDKSLFLAC